MYRNEDQEDLRNHIYDLKKQLMKVNAENYLLKVKVRKLQDEVQKKQRQIDSILDPTTKSSGTNMGKFYYEHSASFLIRMKEKNDDLMGLLSKKDAFIRHLKKQLDVVKSYSQNHNPNSANNKQNFDNGGGGDKKENDCMKIKQVTLKVPTIAGDDDREFRNEPKTLRPMSCEREKNEGTRSRSMSWTSGLFDSIYDASPSGEEKLDSPPPIVTDIKDQYKELPRGHLLSIIENLKNNQRQYPFPTLRSHSGSSRKSSPNSDLERIELFCDGSPHPHEEIQQLQIDFLDMICEIDKLKNTISELQSSKNTKKKRSKSEKPRKFSNNNAAVVARIYNSKSAKDCSKGHYNSIRNELNKNFNTIEKNMKINIRAPNKETATQVEETKDLPVFCSYVRKNGLVITEKKCKDNNINYDGEDNSEEDLESADDKPAL